MNNFIKRNQKKILAVFSVGLMVAFSLPSALKNSNDRRTITAGYAGKTKITSKEITDAHAQWELLKLRIHVKRPDPRTGESLDLPLLLAELGEGFGQSGSQVAARIIEQVDGNPELFYLLTREAEEMGTAVSNDQIQGIIANASFTPDDQPDFNERAQEAIRSLLLVRNSSERAGDLIKVSKPLREQALAYRQQVSLNLVSFKSADYLAKVPSWSEQEQAAKVAAQFEKYKNEEPTTRPSNEFGFGYRVPNQSQVQYIEVPGDAIRQVVSAKISDLDARKYFYQNRAMFPAEPSTKPTTKPASMPTTALAATLPFEPTHEPTFEEAEKKVYERLIAERVNKLTSEILADLNSQMGADYVAFKGAVTETGKAPTTAPSIPEEMLAKAPITSLGVPYGSYEYLKQLALNTQKKFGVLPKTNQDLGPRTDRQLNLAGDIAQSSVEGFDIMSLFRAMGQNFEAVQQIMQQVGPMIRYPTYATNFIVPLATPGVQQAARNFRLRVLALYEPSPLMQGRSMGLSLDSTPSTNNYIFRVVRAEPTHPPTLDEVKDRVLADARMVEAQKLALAEATEFLKGIPSPHSHLESAAKAGSKKLITTGLFSQGQPTVENLDTPPGEPTAIFINAAYQLLNGTSGDRQHPVGLIDFKTAATVFAGEINQIQPGWTPAELPARQLLVGAQIDQQAGGSMRIQWFDAREVRTRTHYVPAQASKKRSSSEEEPS